MEQLQLRHFAIFDPGGEVIFFLQSLLLHVKNGLPATLRISGQQIQFCISCCLTLVKSCFSVADTMVDLVVQVPHNCCEALPIKVAQFTFCERVEVSFFGSSNVFTPYRQRDRPTGICERGITDGLGGLFWGDVRLSFPLNTATNIKFPIEDLVRELTMVTSKGSCTSYWKVIVWLGRSWIPAPLLKNIVPDAVTERLEILTGCWAFILSTKTWCLEPSPFWCVTLTILPSCLEVWTLTSKYRFELDCLCFTGVTCWMYPIPTVDEERDESIKKNNRLNCYCSIIENK